MLRRMGAAMAAALLAMAAGGAGPVPDVTAVVPSGPTIPERLLRISVTFAAPPKAEILSSIALVRQDGGVIEGALLDQELWSPDRRTLTLLLDPGRVKTGLIAHDAAGGILHAGKRVALRVAGRPVRRWTITTSGCVVPDIATWRIGLPRAGTERPLTLAFPGPIDAQSRDLIAVVDGVGHRVEGSARLAAGERLWAFVPTAPWTPGRLRLVVHPRLETPCGDEIGEAFEHAAGKELGTRRTAPSRWFSIQ